MIHENIMFHNVAEVHPKTFGGTSGVRLQRVPEEVRLALNEGAQMRMLQPDNAEIRFCANGPCRLTLSSEGETRVTVFYGLFDSRLRFIIRKQPQTIEIPFGERLMELDESYCRNMSFSPKVCRVIFGGPQREPIVFHKIEGDNIRPPKPEQLPKLRYLSYGTSITHGFDAEGAHLNYVAQTARTLSADLINLGVGGAAYCEHELADHIAQRTDWDIASLALSVNMQSFAMDEFYERVSYMVNTVAGGDTNRPVVCMTLYPYFRDFGVEPAGEYGGSPNDYRQALQKAVEACPHPNVHLVHGPDMLTKIENLTADLIHPSDFGMAEMGRYLAKKFKAILS